MCICAGSQRTARLISNALFFLRASRSLVKLCKSLTRLKWKMCTVFSQSVFIYTRVGLQASLFVCWGAETKPQPIRWLNSHSSGLPHCLCQYTLLFTPRVAGWSIRWRQHRSFFLWRQDCTVSHSKKRKRAKGGYDKWPNKPSNAERHSVVSV